MTENPYEAQLRFAVERAEKAEARLVAAEAERDEARKLAKEFDEYLGEALAALGIENVFQIKDAQARADAAEAELAEARFHHRYELDRATRAEAVIERVRKEALELHKFDDSRGCANRFLSLLDNPTGGQSE